MLGAVGYSVFDHNNWVGSMNWEVISTVSEGVARIRASMLFHIIMRNAEQEFIHMGTGHADDPYLESVDRVLSRSMSSPGLRQWWRTTGEGFNKAFQTHINELIAATDEIPVSSAFHLSNENAT